MVAFYPGSVAVFLKGDKESSFQAHIPIGTTFMRESHRDPSWSTAISSVYK